MDARRFLLQVARDRELNTTLDALLELTAEAEGLDAEGAGGDAEGFGKAALAIDLLAFFVLIILANEVLVVRGKLAEASLKAANRIGIDGWGMIGRLTVPDRGRKILKGRHFAASFRSLGRHEAGDAADKRHEAYDLDLAEATDGAIESLVGQSLGFRAAIAAEESQQLRPKLLIDSAGLVRIRIKSREKLLEGLLGKYPAILRG